jgi:vitamin B12 transporter
MKKPLKGARVASPVLALCGVAAAAMAAAQTLEVNPVVVSASRLPQPLSEVLPSVSVITRADIERSQAPTLADLLQGEAGFEFGRNGGPGAQTSFFLRGQNSTNLVILVDGVRMQTDSGGNLGFTDFPLALIERVEILRGNAGALYGEAAVGGVVHITTRQFKGQPVAFGSAMLGSRQTRVGDVGFAGTQGDVQFHVMGGQTSVGGFSALDASTNPNANPDRDGYRSQFLSAKADKKISADLSLGVRARVQESRVDYDSGYAPYEYAPGQFTRGDLPTDLHRSRKNLETFGVYARKAFTDDWVSTLDVSTARTTYAETTTQLSPAKTVDAGQYASTQLAMRWSNQYQLSAQSTTTFGLDWIDDQHAQKSAFDLNRKTTGAYVGLNQRLGDWALQVNVRQDQLRLQRQQGATATTSTPSITTGLLGVGYQINPVWRWTATTSTGFKAPSAYDLSTNPQVEAEKYRSHETGLVMRTDQVLARVVYFLTETNSAIGYDAFYRAVNIGQTENKGVEASLRTNWWGNRIQLTYVDQKPWNVSDGKPLLRRARNYGALDVSRTVGAYEVGGKITSSDARADFGANLPGYTLLSLYASRKIDQSWTTRVRLENVTGEHYQLARGYNTPGRGIFLTLQYSPKS